MKYKRTKREYGSGTGRTVYEDKFFQVIYWVHCGGKTKRTTLSCDIAFIEIQFDGYVKIDTVIGCIEQLTPNEVFKLFKAIEKEGIRKGEDSIICDIKDVLRIR